MAANSERKIYQPIHPSIRHKLDPQYVEFHDKHLQYIFPYDQEPWDPSARSRLSPIVLGGMKSVEVGSITDRDLGNFQARFFTPEGASPAGGWPVAFWFHGGGWVLGGLGNENAFLQHVCKYIGCVVITINYRHAPEHPYPAAMNDVVHGYEWATRNDVAREFNLDVSNVALSGLSAGACLAAILSLKLADRETPGPPTPRAQVLLSPVVDNTATTAGVWASARHAPWLTAARMSMYRDQYLPPGGTSDNNAGRWDASPCLAPAHLLVRCPPTFIGIGECDLLAPEARRYANDLRAAGVPTDLVVYRGGTHSLLVMAGIHENGRKMVHDACSALAKALSTSYNPAKAPILPRFEPGGGVGGFVL